MERARAEQPMLFRSLSEKADRERLGVLLEELGGRERQDADMGALYQHLLPEKGPGQRLAQQGRAGQLELARLLLLRRASLRSFEYALGPFSFSAEATAVAAAS
jgi:hypothetical protein